MNKLPTRIKVLMAALAAELAILVFAISLVLKQHYTSGMYACNDDFTTCVNTNDPTIVVHREHK